MKVYGACGMFPFAPYFDCEGFLLKQIDRLLQTVETKLISQNKPLNMTNEELDAEIECLGKILGHSKDMSFDDLLQECQDLWDSMTPYERRQAMLLSKKRYL